jgi:molecular chaperone GrpE (heat shock protein)
MSIPKQADHAASEPGRHQKAPVSIVDRRRVGRDDEAPSAEPNLKPSYVEQLEERVRKAEATLKAKVEALEEEARRSRERVERDLALRFEEKERALLQEVLDLLDDVDRAATMARQDPSVAEGLRVIIARGEQFLKHHACEKVVPDGAPFDPASMEAVAVQPGPSGTVVSVLQAGYRRGGHFLRVPRVAVGDGSAVV